MNLLERRRVRPDALNTSALSMESEEGMGQEEEEEGRELQGLENQRKQLERENEERKEKLRRLKEEEKAAKEAFEEGLDFYTCHVLPSRI